MCLECGVHPLKICSQKLFSKYKMKFKNIGFVMVNQTKEGKEPNPHCELSWNLLYIFCKVFIAFFKSFHLAQWFGMLVRCTIQAILCLTPNRHYFDLSGFQWYLFYEGSRQDIEYEVFGRSLPFYYKKHTKKYRVQFIEYIYTNRLAIIHLKNIFKICNIS
jgi:hypothetical protein